MLNFLCIFAAMATRSFVCVSLYVVWILLLNLEGFAAQRSCPPGRFCPIDANCTNNTTLCVIVCPTERDHLQQGNHFTGNCERCKFLFNSSREPDFLWDGA